MTRTSPERSTPPGTMSAIFIRSPLAQQSSQLADARSGCSVRRSSYAGTVDDAPLERAPVGQRGGIGLLAAQPREQSLALERPSAGWRRRAFAATEKPLRRAATARDAILSVELAQVDLVLARAAAPLDHRRALDLPGVERSGLQGSAAPAALHVQVVRYARHAQAVERDERAVLGQAAASRPPKHAGSACSCRLRSRP